MIKKNVLIIVVLVANIFYGFGQKLKTEQDTIDYALGIYMADGLKRQGVDTLDLKLFMKSFKQVYKSDETKVALQDVEKICMDYFQRKRSQLGERTKKKGVKFLEENKSKEGITALPSGLQYEIIKKGEGPKPAATDKVKVHYHGTLLDGTVFDSSVDRGEPVTFPLNRVIKGWTEGVQLMSVGAKYRFFIPYDLAYGERGAGGMIGPYETLIFEVELLEIVNE